MKTATAQLLTIEPKKGWVSIDFRDLWIHRELLYFLAKRDINVRYKQTLLGGLWAIIQPLASMVVFSFSDASPRCRPTESPTRFLFMRAL